MQQFYQDLLAEFRRVGEAISGLSDRMGKVETSVTHIIKRQDETSALDARVDANDKRITILEKAAETDEKRGKSNGEWTRWGVGLVVTVILMGAGSLVTWLLAHIHFK